MSEQWTCGHVAGAMCAECYREVAAIAHAKTNELVLADCQLADAAAFLDRMTQRLADEAENLDPKNKAHPAPTLNKWAADCRAMAERLRGET